MCSGELSEVARVALPQPKLSEERDLHGCYSLRDTTPADVDALTFLFSEGCFLPAFRASARDVAGQVVAAFAMPWFRASFPLTPPVEPPDQHEPLDPT